MPMTSGSVGPGRCGSRLMREDCLVGIRSCRIGKGRPEDRMACVSKQPLRGGLMKQAEAVFGLLKAAVADGALIVSLPYDATKEGKGLLINAGDARVVGAVTEVSLDWDNTITTGTRLKDGDVEATLAAIIEAGSRLT